MGPGGAAENRVVADSPSGAGLWSLGLVFPWFKPDDFLEQTPQDLSDLHRFIYLIQAYCSAPSLNVCLQASPSGIHLDKPSADRGLLQRPVCTETPPPPNVSLLLSLEGVTLKPYISLALQMEDWTH